MQLSQGRSSKFRSGLAIAALSFCLGLGAWADTGSTAPAKSKSAGVEVTGTQATEEAGAKRAQLLNDVIAPSYQTTTPEAAKVKREIMDELEHKSEPEPFCYYPI